MISIKENVKDIVIPSEEQHIELHPMDFEEFLWALNNEKIMDFIRECFKNEKTLGEAMHYFRKYMIVGGMPQVVQEYVETQDFNKVDLVKRNILELYRNDIAKHANGNALKVRNLFDAIPSELQKHEKKFKISSLEKMLALEIMKKQYFG